MKYTLDAKGKKLGRLATEAATLLMGKQSPAFQKHILSETEVEVINASKLSLDAGRLRDKIYTRYSGYPGGLRKETQSRLIARKGYGEIVRRAVRRMLPANKLRAKRMVHLVVKE